MTAALPLTTEIISQLNALDAELKRGEIKPYPASMKKRTLILEGLIALGRDCDANVTADAVGQSAGDTILLKADDMGYGSTLAVFLNTIPVRHGVKPTIGFVNGYNRWAYIEPHDAHSMLLAAPETARNAEGE